MVDLPSAYTDDYLVFLMFSLVLMEFFKCALGCGGLLSIDRYYPQVFLSLCWNLMTGQ